MRRQLLPILVIAGLSCTPMTPKYEFKYAEKRAVLDNGLRLIVVPDKNTNLVEVDVRYSLGSNYDPANMAGIAHLVEHMMFQHRLLGPDKPATFNLLPQISPGFFNAYTNWDTTHYMLNGRAEDVDKLLRLEAQRMAKHCDTIPPEEFEREREVVRNEIRQRAGTPEGKIPQLIMSAAYPKGHPYEQMIGGDDTQLTNISMADVCKFMETYYVPSNATVIVVGNVDPEAVGKTVYSAFSQIPAGTPVSKTDVPPVTIKETVQEVELDVDYPMINVAWALPPSYEDAGQRARVFTAAVASQLGRFNTGYMDQTMKWVDGYNFSPIGGIAQFQLGGERAPLGVLIVELRSWDRKDQAMEFIRKSIANAHRYFEGDKELWGDRLAVQQAAFIKRVEDLGSRSGYLGDLAQFSEEVPWDSDKEILIHEFNRIGKMTGDEVRKEIEKMQKQSAAWVLVKPEKDKGKYKRAKLKYKTKAHDKTVKPVIPPEEAHVALPVPATDSPLAKAERYELGNGARVVLLPYSAVPLVTAEVLFDVGSAHDPADKAGVLDWVTANLMAPLGASVFQRLGWNVRASSDEDHATFGLHTVSIYAPKMLKALERFIRAGDFNQDIIELNQKALKGMFERKRSRQTIAFGKTFHDALYGPDHPYRPQIQGMAVTPESIGKLNYDALQAYRRKHFSAANMTIIVAGNFDVPSVKASIEHNFGSWSKGHKDEPVVAPMPARSGPTFIGVTGDALPQIDVRIGFPGAIGRGPQDAIRSVLSTMLTQKMGAIRTKLGSTYGVYGRHVSRVGPGYYTIGGTIDAPRGGESLKAMRDGIQELRDGVEFDKEFATARRTVQSRLLADSTVSRDVAARLTRIEAYNLPDDYYDQLLRDVSTLTPDQVKKVIADELSPEKEVIVILGGKEDLEATFAGAGIESVRYVEP